MFNCRTLAPGLLIQPKAVQKLTWLNDSREGTRLRRSDGVAEQMPSRKNRAKARQHLLSNRHLGVEEYIAKLSLLCNNQPMGWNFPKPFLSMWLKTSLVLSFRDQERGAEENPVPGVLSGTSPFLIKGHFLTPGRLPGNQGSGSHDVLWWRFPALGSSGPGSVTTCTGRAAVCGTENTLEQRLTGPSPPAASEWFLPSPQICSEC